MKELFIGIFIITSAAQSHGDTEQDAYRNASQAAYKQSGLEDAVNKYVEKELKNVPESIKKITGNTFLIAKTIQERKIVYTWSF